MSAGSHDSHVTMGMGCVTAATLTPRALGKACNGFGIQVIFLEKVIVFISFTESMTTVVKTNNKLPWRQSRVVPLTLKLMGGVFSLYEEGLEG